MNGWQPIETAPKDGTIVLLWCKPIDRLYASPEAAKNLCIGYHGDSGSIHANEGWRSVESREEVWGYGSEMTGPMTETECLHVEPTHWMPLPPPPGTRRIPDCNDPDNRDADFIVEGD